MYQKVRQFMEQHHMINPRDAVAAGVSGGADSVCLLLMLKKLQKEIPFRLFVVHINHGLRVQAGEDEEFVRALCERENLPFFAIHVNVREEAQKRGMSEEEAGRSLRYEAFEEVLKKEAPLEWQGQKAKIAVAHNKNDRAETMLFHLFRGTGLAGLCSILPVREHVIRPVLCLQREEIEEYLLKESVSYCTDCTNNEDTYTRNKIRHHILPYVTEAINPSAVERMNHTAELLREAGDYLKEETQKALTRTTVFKETGEVVIHVPSLKKEPDYLKKQLLLSCLERLVPGRKDISSVHIYDMLGLADATESKSVDLPYGIRALKEYDSLSLEAGEQKGKKMPLFIPIDLTNPEEIYVPECGSFTFSVFTKEEFPYRNIQDIPQKKYTKWFDYDRIIKSVVIRKRKSGDYLTINEAMSKKSLKDYFIQEKIPKSKRDDMIILAEDSHVLWVVGFRISQKYKINENTKRILQVQLKGGTSWQNM